MNLAFDEQGNNPGQGGNLGGQGGNSAPAEHSGNALAVPIAISGLGVLLLLTVVSISVYRHVKNSQWSRSDVIGVLGVIVMIVGIVVSLLNPEIRKWLGF